MRRFVRGMFTRSPGEEYLERLTADALRTPPAVAAALGNYAVQRSFWKEAVYSVKRPILYIVRQRFAAQAANLAAKDPLCRDGPVRDRRSRAVRRRCEQSSTRCTARLRSHPGLAHMKRSPKLPSLWPLFLVSGAAVGFEIALTRYFAVAKWSEYGYWVISIVMAGFALSGVAVALGRDAMVRRGEMPCSPGCRRP